MFALVRVAGFVLCLAGLLAAGCGPVVTTSPGTPSTKTPPTNGTPVKPPENDRG
jgi:hypothetical protein